MKLAKLVLKLLLLFIIFLPPVYAWEAHSLLTFFALQKMPEINSAPLVAAETLEHFLQKEKTGLIKLLDEHEQWAIQHIVTYPPLPASLTFKALAQQNKPLKMGFMQSIRVNPTLELPLYIQNLPGSSHQNSSPLPVAKAMKAWLADQPSIRIYDPPLEVIKPGDKITPLQVIATAADEPDYGLDLELWEDNHSWFAKLYHFGKTPFGNPKVRLSTQAPFHMGFYYESPLFYLGDKGLKRCYPEYRIHLYLTLAKYAFQTEHSYWGNRFLGWALHYIQDLAQPYHSTALPNVSMLKTSYAQFLYILHLPSAQTDLIQLVTNKHYALENYEFFKLHDAAKKNDTKNPIIKALTNPEHDHQYPSYDDSYPRAIVAKESHDKADRVDDIILATFPHKYVSDPNYLFYITEPSINLVEVTKNSANPVLRKLDTELFHILQSTGSHTRNVVKYVYNAINIKNNANQTFQIRNSKK